MHGCSRRETPTRKARENKIYVSVFRCSIFTCGDSRQVNSVKVVVVLVGVGEFFVSGHPNDFTMIS